MKAGNRWQYLKTNTPSRLRWRPEARNAVSTEERMCRWLLMMHVRAAGAALPYTHEFLSNMLGANRRSVTIAAQSLQNAGAISYRRGKITIVDRAKLELASCECYAIVKERFDAFLIPPSTAVQGDTAGRQR